MKLLYISNHRYIKDKAGNYFTTGQLNNTYFNRFQKEFQSVTIIGIFEEESNTNERKKVEKVDTETGFLEFDLIHSEESFKSHLVALKGLKEKAETLLVSHDRIAAKAPSLIARDAVKIAKKSNTPILLEVVGCPWDAYWNHSLKGKILAPAMWFSAKSAIKKAPFVVYVTSEFLQKRYPTMGKHTNCSNVNITNCSNDILEKRLAKLKSYDKNNKMIIGTLGAVNVKYKGQQYVIEALGELKKQGIENFEYQIVGGGESTYLKSIAFKYGVSNQVKFLGSLPHTEVFEWLDNNIDIYIQPSLTEGLPRALIEAMSRGLLAIGSNAGGIPELISPKYIYKNNVNRVDSITNLLKNIKVNEMIAQGKDNFERSKEYKKEEIQSRREALLKDFAAN